MRALIAWIEGRRVGTFTESPRPDGSIHYAFDYESVTSKDIVSLTMVPTEAQRRFELPVFPPPFDMVLPEGERRTQIEGVRKILRTDSFSLLGYVGGNPVNRVQFLAPDQTPGELPPELPAPAEIASTRDGLALFRDLVADLDLRQGIAGVQPKVLGAPAPEKVSAQLRQFRGSTHILKASTTRFPFLAANEFLCLGVLARAGIRVPTTTLSADGQLLLVDRFDVQADGHVRGFEEAAALMGETSETKYQRDVGSMIDVLCDFIAPLAHANTRLILAKALVLNHLLGNGDAHLKNFGVLYDDDTRVELAPIYDCVSTLPYIPNDVPALTLSVEWYSKAWWPRIKIEEFVAHYGGLSQRQIVALFEEAFDAVMAGVGAARQYGRDIAGFAELAETIATLWTTRVDSFRAEPSQLKKVRRGKTS